MAVNTLWAQQVHFSKEKLSDQVFDNCVLDMNNDGLDDIVGFEMLGIHIFLQNPLQKGKFTDTFYDVELPVSKFMNTPVWSIAAGDFDNDGHNDFIIGGGTATVIKANKDGTAYQQINYDFPGGIFIPQRVNFIDINNDGFLDGFICNDVGTSFPMQNDKRGNLTVDNSLLPTYIGAGNYASIWTDFDNDGDIDMYYSKCRGGASKNDSDRINILYQNNGDGTFTDIAKQAGVDDASMSWSTIAEDFDNDGDFDFYVLNTCTIDNDDCSKITNNYYQNNGDGTFTKIPNEKLGLPTSIDSSQYEGQGADFNNDGFVDILIDRGDFLYLNNGDGTFTGQKNFPEEASKGAIGDLNNDGFLEIYNYGNIFWNNSIKEGNKNNWLRVNLTGTKSNRNGIGAKVIVTDNNNKKQIREIRSGNSFGPMSSLIAHFGLGKQKAKKIEVKWPSGKIDVLKGNFKNQLIKITESK